MAYQRYKLAVLGPSNASLATVGFEIRNSDGTVNTARTTTGVAERPAGSGTYGATVTFADGFRGELRWDTGAATPEYASEEINPEGITENLDAKVSTRSSHSATDVWAVGTRTLSAFAFSVTVGTNNDKTGYGLADGAITAAKFGAGAIDANAIATDALGSLELAAGAATEIAAAIAASGVTLSAAGLDAVLVESGLNARQALSLIAATQAGVLSGAVPGVASTITILGAGVGTTRVVSDCDSAGNRTSITLSPPA